MAINWICPKCGKKILLPSKEERERGWCASCEVASWSDEKRKAFLSIVGGFAQGVEREEMEKRIDDGFKHLKEGGKG